MGNVVQRSAEDDRRNNEQPKETQEEVQMPLDQSTVSGSGRLCLLVFMNERVQYFIVMCICNVMKAVRFEAIPISDNLALKTPSVTSVNKQ